MPRIAAKKMEVIQSNQRVPLSTDAPFYCFHTPHSSNPISNRIAGAKGARVNRFCVKASMADAKSTLREPAPSHVALPVGAALTYHIVAVVVQHSAVPISEDIPARSSASSEATGGAAP